MSTVVEPESVFGQEKRVESKWPEWRPAVLAHREDTYLPFSYLDVGQGLRSSSVKCLLQDRQGKYGLEPNKEESAYGTGLDSPTLLPMRG